MTPPEDPPGPDITASLKSSPLHPSRFAHELLLLVLEADPDLCLVNNAKHGDGTDYGSEDVLMNHTLLSLSHTCRYFRDIYERRLPSRQLIDKNTVVVTVKDSRRVFGVHWSEDITYYVQNEDKKAAALEGIIESWGHATTLLFRRVTRNVRVDWYNAQVDQGSIIKTLADGFESQEAFLPSLDSIVFSTIPDENVRTRYPETLNSMDFELARRNCIRIKKACPAVGFHWPRYWHNDMSIVSIPFPHPTMRTCDSRKPGSARTRKARDYRGLLLDVPSSRSASS